MADGHSLQRVRDGLPYPLTHVLVSDLREGQSITQCFLVRRKAQRSTRTGEPYLELVLSDRSGAVPARAWAEATQRYAATFAEGDFVYVEGRTETYRNALQLIVRSIRRLDLHEAEAGSLPGFELELLVPSTEHDVEKMWAEILELAASIASEPLRRLTTALLEDHEERWKSYPAALFHHHAYVGGLLEHTLEVARTASWIESWLPEVDRDLLLAGAILHDAGKLCEMENPVAPRFTLEGHLSGHLLLGRDIIRDQARKQDDLDERTLRLLEHIIISHHGEPEYGAARRPMTLESIALYYLDNLSAKLNAAAERIRSDSREGDFTDWQQEPPGGSRLYKGERTGEDG
ncbi:MAG: HD domain-containing protein [Candidatus Bipolaricaulota bacterium]|nr:MAG: HD domain-containing protein [Candidatus Bipolaricaulota bacterium]